MVPSLELDPKWELVWKFVSIYKQRTTAEKGEKREGSICCVLGIISKAGPSESRLHVPCPNARGGGKCSKDPVSGWLGAISRLTTQLNKGELLFKCNWTLDAPKGCFALGIPLLWKATLHLPSPDQGFDIRLSDTWVKERFLSALAGEYTNIPNFKCSAKTLLLIRCVEWSLFSQKAQNVRGFGFLFPGWSGGVEWKHYCVWNRGSKTVGVGGRAGKEGLTWG